MGAFLCIYAGHVAGVATSVLWTGTSLFFTAAGRCIGPTLVNSLRIVLAILLHVITYRLVSGDWFPHASSSQITYLALSGVVGLSVGDQALFTAFLDVGPRIAMLVMTTSPLFAVAFGWLALGERLSVAALAGVVMIVLGVAWVVLERSTTPPSAMSTHRRRGFALALLAAACQAGGLLLSKKGMGTDDLPSHQQIAPQAATLLRLLFASVGMLPIILFARARSRRSAAAGKTTGRSGTPLVGLIFMSCGTVVGPYLGVWMSLVAVQRTAQVGVAQALCSLTPVFLIVYLRVVRGESITLRAAAGAAIAVAGSAMLFIF